MHLRIDTITHSSLKMLLAELIHALLRDAYAVYTGDSHMWQSTHDLLKQNESLAKPTAAAKNLNGSGGKEAHMHAHVGCCCY